MSRSHSIALLVLVTLSACVGASRVPGAPYPLPSAGLNSTSLLYVVDQTQVDMDHALLAASLQGIVSRVSPSVYRTLGNSSIWTTWLTVLESEFGVTASWAYQNDPLTLVRKLRPDLAGFVLANLTDTNSISAALTAAGLLDAVVATPVTAPGLISSGYKLLYDLRGLNVTWVLNTLNGTAANDGAAVSATVTVLQDPTKLTCLVDWSIFARAANWYCLDMSDALSQRIWSSVSHGNASVFGWGYSELDCVGAGTLAGAWTHATDWAINLDVYASFDIPAFHQLPRQAAASAAQRQTAERLAAIGVGARAVRTTPPPTFPDTMFTPPSSPTDKVHTVTLLMTDGDNVQWLLGDFFTDPNFWASPDRGVVPLGWTMSPALADLAPSVLASIYATAARPNSTAGLRGSDVFVGAPSGVGYAYPDAFAPSALKPFSSLTSAYMGKADIQLLNLIAASYTESAATELLSQPEIDALIWYEFSSYIGLNGKVTWIPVPNPNGIPPRSLSYRAHAHLREPHTVGPGTVQKPVIGGRFLLWDGTFDNATSLAQKLLAQPRDASTSAGYSLIPVHVWTNNVTSVVSLVEQLAAGAPDGSVRVVAPDDFVAALAANTRPAHSPRRAGKARVAV